MELLIYLTTFGIGVFLGHTIERHFLGDLVYLKFIENKDKKPRENDDYFLLHDNGVNYLFTEKEVIKALERANKHPEDLED
jgi:hypothetical protein